MLSLVEDILVLIEIMEASYDGLLRSFPLDWVGRASRHQHFQVVDNSLVERMVGYDSLEVVDVRSFSHLVGSIIMQSQVGMVDSQVSHNDSADEEKNDSQAHPRIGPLRMFITPLVNPQIIANQPVVIIGLQGTTAQKSPQEG